MKNLKFYSLFLVALSAHQLAHSQSYNSEEEVKLNSWSITGYGGITKFFGDLTEYNISRGEKESFTGGWGLSVNKQFSPIFGLQLTTTNGSLSGSKRGVVGIDLNTKKPTILPDGSRKVYDVYFRTNGYWQFTLDGSVNLVRLFFGPNKLRRWKVDAHAGLGQMYFHSRLYDMNTNELKLTSNTDLSTTTGGIFSKSDTYYTREWVVPVGLGVHYEISPRFDIGIDMVFNNVNTEKIDLTAGGLSDYDKGTGIWAFYYGDSRRDKYAFGTLAITYKLGKKAKRAKNGQYNDPDARYHARWTTASQLVAKPYSPTADDADSIAKSNMPGGVDARLYSDSDGDGIADLFDKEPDTKSGSVVSGSGVAMDVNSITEESVKMNQPAADCDSTLTVIEFNNNESTISADQEAVFKSLVERLNGSPNCRVVLTGHADSTGSNSYNYQISRRRVLAVRKTLVDAGLQFPDRVLVEYYGKYRPSASNASEVQGKSDRRVEIRILPSNSTRSGYPAGFRD